jgi:predicted ester cyclase
VVRTGGIGTARGLLHYQAVHQRPFLTAFPDRVGGNHKCRIAEGPYVALTGWPSVRATHLGGGFLGLPPSGRAVGMRVMDFWRCADGLIRENWVFIDLPDLLLQMGLDVLWPARACSVGRAGRDRRLSLPPHGDAGLRLRRSMTAYLLYAYLWNTGN